MMSNKKYNTIDLFAGCGQLGLEALSRGAKKATFSDSSRDAADIVMRNAKKSRLFDKCRISAADFTSFIRGAAGREKYDLIFLDPPYNTDLLPASLKAIASADICAVGAQIVCETDCDIPLKKSRMRKDEDLAAEYVMNDVFGGDEELASRFEVKKTTLYGRTRITVLTPSTAE